MKVLIFLLTSFVLSSSLYAGVIEERALQMKIDKVVEAVLCAEGPQLSCQSDFSKNRLYRKRLKEAQTMDVFDGEDQKRIAKAIKSLESIEDKINEQIAKEDSFYECSNSYYSNIEERMICVP